MTGRERVLAAVAHKEADRVPIDQGSMRSTGIMAVAYNRLKEHLAIDGPPTFLYDLIQQLAQPDEWYLDRFHVDAVDAGVGDLVLLVTDGFSAMTSVGRPQSPIDMAVVGFIDQIDLFQDLRR